MSSEAAEGGCLCGAVRYRLNGKPMAASLCHCRSCRLAAGAPSMAWVVMHSSDVEFVKGQPTVFQSSPGVRRSFCGECGTALTWQRETEQDSLDFATATLDRPDAFPPRREIWTSEKIGWACSNPALPQHPGSSRDS